MHVRLVAVGDRQPSWAVTAFDHYVTRLPRQWRFRLESVSTARRNRGESVDVSKRAEGEKILARLKPADFIIALDENGRQATSKGLASKLDQWQIIGADLVFIIGGPDGLAKRVLERADSQWSLSQLTLPHALARVLFAEQLYRAWSLLSGHPYHRQ